MASKGYTPQKVGSGTASASKALADAHKRNAITRHGGKTDVSYDESYANAKSRRWYNREKLVRDDGLVAKGYEYYRGDPSKSPSQMRAMGYVSNAEAGGRGGSSAKSWYKKKVAPAPAPKAKAKAKPTYKPKTAGKKPAPSYLKSNTTKDAGGTNRSTGYHYNPDWNANLKEATIKGNEDNTRRLASFDKVAQSKTNAFNKATGSQTDASRRRNNGFADSYKNSLNRNTARQDRDSQHQTNIKNRDSKNAYHRYNNRTRNILSQMGTADQDIHTRNRGSAFAGLDSGFSEAGDQLQARLAQRGLANAGIGAKAHTDMARDRAIAGSTANTNAYTSAIDMSDSRRGTRMQGEDKLYGANLGKINDQYSTNMSQINSRFANQNNLAGTNFNTNIANSNDSYQKSMAQLGQSYGSDMAIQGQSLQNNINNNQQRIANLMGYSQLGRGMAGMSQNYLSQAGSGFGNIAGQAGQTAIGVGSNNNSYNATMQQAQTAQNKANADAQAGKGSAVGSLVGAGITKYSDSRLKMNVKKIGESNGHNIVTWDWNEIGKEIAGDAPTVGVIAQEAEKIDPSSVTVADNGYMKVDYNKIFNGVA